MRAKNQYNAVYVKLEINIFSVIVADEWSPEEKEEEKEEEQLHQGRERKRDIFWDIWEDLQ